MDWVIVIGLCLLLYLGIAWHHGYVWRRQARGFRREHYADQVRANVMYPAFATPVTPIEPDDGRDAVRAAIDAPRVLAKTLWHFVSKPRDRYRPSPRCTTCNTCIVEAGLCWGCWKREQGDG